MSIRATVRGGRLVVDEPTELPEGTELELVVDDGGSYMTEDEIAKLNASLKIGFDQAKRGEGVPFEEVLQKLRAQRKT